MDTNAELRILRKAPDENPFAAVSLHLVAKRQHLVLPVWNHRIDVPHDPAAEGIGVIRLKAIAILVCDHTLELACRFIRRAIQRARTGGAFAVIGALERVGCESLGCHDDATDCILPKRIVAAAIGILGIEAAWNYPPSPEKQLVDILVGLRPRVIKLRANSQKQQERGAAAYASAHSRGANHTVIVTRHGPEVVGAGG
jgi:hypothetical protein